MQEQKNTLRALMGKKRQSIGKMRRIAALQYALDTLLPLLKSHSLVLSFASFGSEFYTLPINKTLAANQKLVLPKTEYGSLRLFLIEDFAQQLSISPLGMLEPNPQNCKEIAIEDVSAILVPGLAFDVEKNRLGYGKGYYDRLLQKLHFQTLSIGVGFIEQLVSEKLPVMPHDVPLKTLYLF